ncbi:Glu/Leu/Phe/Val family dehydrogenase [Sphingomonas jatrophae]|uniref:Leucine dehydrogenase n=1 Tax=Sphingomonas jatrophae TaxID=1166337 RepID=A0A1I6JC76_9SPHN|nr:Glu/Leu/Phe/Val dehydrogenase dimerization domain-containing protein [Sphingomonas jatrophae]SFR76542.1 leucine dehydrogenase [Sphingomonas jatrophae]
MTAPWTLPDFDDHEGVHIFRDAATGLTGIVGVHSTTLGPALGGTRFWHYPTPEDAVVDALRLSRGMSYKNAMAGLPLGGGKAVILAGPDRRTRPEQLAAFARAIESLGGRYVTAQDVGLTQDDMATLAEHTRFICGQPGAEKGMAGGDSGPPTALGVYLGLRAAIARALGKDDPRGVHVAIQGVGSVGGNLARRLAADGARLTLADVYPDRAQSLAAELGAEAVPAEAILAVDADVVSPCALGAVLNEGSIAAMKARVVAGAANNQLATAEDAARLHARGILYAPDYVINAGGVINVGLQYLGGNTMADVEARIAQIPARLEQVWAESAVEDRPAAEVADDIARRLIGRA